MAFHLHEGWYFERLNKGKMGAGVHIYRKDDIRDVAEVSMTLDDWISIVTEMAGGTAEQHEAAKALYR